MSKRTSAAAVIEAAALQAIEPLEARRLLSVDVLSYRNSLQNLGVNSGETQLTPGNVNVSSFGKQFSVPLDGQAYSEPLVKTGVNITTGANPGVHDVVFVTTQHDSLYAIDANGGTVLWHDSFIFNAAGNPNPLNANIPSGVTTVPSGDVNSSDINPEIGITSTPTIDPANGFLYLTAKTKELVTVGTVTYTHYVYRLHKINIQNGVDTSVVIGDTIYSGGVYYYRTTDTGTGTDPYVIGTGDGNITSQAAIENRPAANFGTQHRVYFNALREMNRPGLTLYNGHIYIAWASHGDNGPYHGWLLGFDENTLALTGALNTTPNGGLGGIWQGGGIASMDAQGNFYFETGNGTFDGQNGPNNTHTGPVTGLDANGFPVNGDYGDSFVKVALDPTTTQGNQGTNKNGWGFKVVDYFAPFNNHDLDGVDRDLGSGAPIVLPDSAGSAAHPHLLVGAGKEGKLYLVDRDNMGHYGTTDNVVQTVGSAISGSLDSPAYFNGRLYYMEGYGGPVKSWALSGASINTATGVQQSPDSLGQLNGSPFISANGTMNGIVWVIDRGTNQLRAYDAGNLATELWTSNQNPGRDSLGGVVKFGVPTAVNGRVYVDTAGALVSYGPPIPPTSPPAAPTGLTATPVSGSQINLNWVDNATNEDGYAIEESTDNGAHWTQIATTGVNTTFWPVGGLQLATTYSFRVRAFNSFNTLSYSGYSNTASATTTSLPPTLDFSTGFASAANQSQIQLNGNAKFVGSNLELTDGNNNEASSAYAKTQQDATHFSTSFSFQISGAAAADGLTFLLQNNLVTTVGAGGGSLGYQGIGNSVAIKFDIYPSLSTTGLYTGGAAPGEDANAIDMSASGIDLHSGHIFNVSLTYDGTTLQEIVTDASTNASFGHNYTINIPTTVGANTAFAGFTGATGGLNAIQDIKTWTYTSTTQTPPAAPSNLVLTPASGTEIDLSWTDNANNETGFKIERSTDGVNYAQIGTTVTNQTTFNDTALTPATQYWYRVRATNPAGDSAYATAGPLTTPVPPNVPSNFAASQITQTSVHLTWQDNSNDEQGFKVLRKIGTGQFIQVAALPPNSTSYDDATLAPGTSYDYHVQAYNIAGYSDFTGGTVLTLTAAPTNLSATAGDQSVALSWTAPTGAVSYDIYRTGNGSPEALIASGVTAANYTDTSGLVNGQTYSYRVAGVDATGEGGSATVSNVTPHTIPAAVVNRAIFYNNSFWDNAAHGFNNDNAIDTGKTALTWGQTATPANYTGSSKGINGIMVDVQHLPAGTPTASDFTFKVGTTNDVSSWATAPAPAAITVRRGAGTGGSDRIEITWADNVIQNTWLQVTVKADAATGITAPDMFIFGNLVGDTGNDTTGTSAIVTASDLASIRAASGAPVTAATASDINKDGVVDSTDSAIIHANFKHVLPKITVPPPPPAPAAPAAMTATPSAASAAITTVTATATSAPSSSPTPTPRPKLRWHPNVVRAGTFSSVAIPPAFSGAAFGHAQSDNRLSEWLR